MAGADRGAGPGADPGAGPDGAAGPGVAEALAAHRPGDEMEAADVARIQALIAAGGDPWSRSQPVHVTGSALVVHPPTGRVLLRWHVRMGSWLQVGGHGDPGESSPLAVARREGREETGLADLAPWPEPAAPRLVHVVIVPVPEGKGEPAHHHADLRYLLATARPGDARPERSDAPLRWMAVDEARALVAEDNLRVTLDRAAVLLAGADLDVR
ncbi:MAG TPA: NUDIX domain-containing protein [Acidimicrobiales bacterium]|nr:NUDIX domain-containing protein [Acidimicrobiales bacterium]